MAMQPLNEKFRPNNRKFYNVCNGSHSNEENPTSIFNVVVLGSRWDRERGSQACEAVFVPGVHNFERRFDEAHR
jgi:hypothetical protein